MKKLLIILILGLTVATVQAGEDLYWFICVTNDTSQTLHINMGNVNHAISLDISFLFFNGEETSFQTSMPDFDLLPGQYFRANIIMSGLGASEDPDDYQQMVVKCKSGTYAYFLYNQEGLSPSGPGVGYDHTCTYDFEDGSIYPKVLYQYKNDTPPFDCFFDQHYDDDSTFRDDMVFVDAGKGGLPTGVGTDTMTQVGNAPDYNY